MSDLWDSEVCDLEVTSDKVWCTAVPVNHSSFAYPWLDSFQTHPAFFTLLYCPCAFVFIYLVIYLGNTAELCDENDPCCAGDLLDVQFNLNFVALDSDLTSCKSQRWRQLQRYFCWSWKDVDPAQWRHRSPQTSIRALWDFCFHFKRSLSFSGDLRGWWRTSVSTGDLSVETEVLTVVACVHIWSFS